MISIPAYVVVELYASITSSLAFTFLAFLVYFHRKKKRVMLFKKTSSLLDFITYFSLIKTVSSSAFRDELAQMAIASSLNLGSPEDFRRAVRRSLSSNKTYLQAIPKALTLKKKLIYNYRTFKGSLYEGLVVSGLSFFLASGYSALIYLNLVSPFSSFTYLLLGMLAGFSIISVYLLYKMLRSLVNLTAVKENAMKLYEGTKFLSAFNVKENA